MPFQTFYISPSGSDKWSGLLPESNAVLTDGPFASLERARDAVRTLKKTGQLTGSVTVYLRAGSYLLPAPVTFTADDSAPVTYAAYPGEAPVLTGGKRITGWRTVQVNGLQAWSAELNDDIRYFRQLFVNGERRHRARLPKVEIIHAKNGVSQDGHPEVFYYMENVPGITFEAQLFDGTNSFVAAAGDIQPWKYLSDAEVVALHYWIEERMPIASFDPASRLVTSTRRSTFALKDDYDRRWAKYYIDNVFEGLTEPGEWFLERLGPGKGFRLYYLPLPSEDLAMVEVVAPQIEQFIRLAGDPDHGQYVEFLCFKGLTFEHADWHQPAGMGDPSDKKLSVDANMLEFAAAPQAAFDVPGVIQMEAARFCSVENCTIRHIGGYGIELRDGCRGIRMVGNHVHDLGAGGIHINGTDIHGPRSRLTGDNVITDNHIHAGGRVFHSGIGILSRHAFCNQIAHNHIHDFFYSAISCGWVWGYQESVSMQNIIEMNHIHDLGHGWLSDMGGVYLLGVQPGTVVRGNLIYDIEKANYGGWALYTDEGSTGIVLENNICYQTNAQLFHQHYGHENIVRNNIFAFGGEAGVALSKYDGTQAFTFERNIVLTLDKPIFIGGYANNWSNHPVLSDLNLFWSVSGDKQAVCFQQSNAPDSRILSFAEWQALGYDTHSILADPKFDTMDFAPFVWKLASDSPAFALGFRPIDLSEVGPRRIEDR